MRCNRGKEESVLELMIAITLMTGGSGGRDDDPHPADPPISTGFPFSPAAAGGHDRCMIPLLSSLLLLSLLLLSSVCTIGEGWQEPDGKNDSFNNLQAAHFSLT